MDAASWSGLLVGAATRCSCPAGSARLGLRLGRGRLSQLELYSLLDLGVAGEFLRHRPRLRSSFRHRVPLGRAARADGSLFTGSTAATHLAALKNHQAQFGFRYHLDMYDAVRNSGESAADAVERVWNAITSNPTTRATFINNVKNVLAANNMTGFNFDWERPNTVTEWGNYTQLAREMQAAFPEHWEVSVDDYGFASSLWDDSPLFDARVYDQIGMMGYHYPANNGTSLDQQSFADGKKALTGQGVEKAFKDSQIIIGMGTWGDERAGDSEPEEHRGGESQLAGRRHVVHRHSAGHQRRVATGTWDIVSRYEVRDNVQLALDRGMAGVMWWALSYDATNKMSLARVAQHYAMFKRGVPDLNARRQGERRPTPTRWPTTWAPSPAGHGTNTAAQFEDFYMSGNWEKGDRDGNGFVNQADADWLAGRFTALGVNMPDRLAYQRHVRKLSNGARRHRPLASQARNGRQPARDGQLHAARRRAAYLDRHRRRRGDAQQQLRDDSQPELAPKRSTALNTAPRMHVGRSGDADRPRPETRKRTSRSWCEQNTAPLSPSQLASPNRTLSLEFLDSAGVNQFDFAFRGQQQQFAHREPGRCGGPGCDRRRLCRERDVPVRRQDRRQRRGAPTRMQASLFASGANVGNFTSPTFPGCSRPRAAPASIRSITQLQFTSLYEAQLHGEQRVGRLRGRFLRPALRRRRRLQHRWHRRHGRLPRVAQDDGPVRPSAARRRQRQRHRSITATTTVLAGQLRPNRRRSGQGGESAVPEPVRSRSSR